MFLQCRSFFSSPYWSQSKKTIPCLLSSLTRHLCTEDGNPTIENKKLTIQEQRDLEGQLFLDTLSPEMKKKKMRFESEVQILQESGHFHDYQLSPGDWKVMLTDIDGYTGIKKYLQYRSKKKLLKELDKSKKKKKVKTLTRDQSKEETAFDPDIDSVYNYTKHDNRQEARRKNHLEAYIMRSSPSPVIFDMDYSASEREEMRAFMQINEAVGMNRYHREPCAIHLASYHKNSVIRLRKNTYFDPSHVTFHEERFDEIFPREKLVYLSPNAPQLLHHNPGDIYIIGGWVDLKHSAQSSFKKCRELKVKAGSLPFVRHGIRPGQVSNSRGIILTLNCILEIILNINLKHNWDEVMDDFRKRHVKKTQYSDTPQNTKKFKRFL